MTTIEGLAARWHAQSGDRPPSLHPVQQGFLDEGGAQCGFCTAGMVMAAAGFLEASPAPAEAEIRAAVPIATRIYVEPAAASDAPPPAGG